MQASFSAHTDSSDSPDEDFPSMKEVCLVDEPLFGKKQRDWGLGRLRSLVLVNCGLSAASCSQLATVLNTSPGLEELNLARNPLGVGFETLVQPLLELSLKRVSFARTSISTSIATALVPGLSAVTLLDMSNNSLGDAFIEALARSWPSQLAHLYLAYNRFTAIQQLIAVTAGLSTLDLSHNPMPISSPLPFIATLRLRGLHIASSLPCETLSLGWSHLDAEIVPSSLIALDCPAARLSAQAIASLSLCVNMQRINLTGCGLGLAAGEVMLALPHLTHVLLGTNHMDTPCVMKVLTALSECRQLLVLDLSDNPACNWDISALSPVNTLEKLILASIALPDGLAKFIQAQQSLAFLDLSKSGLNSQKLAEIISALRDLPLTELHLSGNDFSEANSAFPQIPTLQRIDLAGCHLTSCSLQSLCTFLPPSLTHLHLFNNPLGPTSLPAFPALQSLNLHKCELRNSGVELLSPCLSSKLQELRLGWNYLTAACVPLLASALPAGLEYLSLFENDLDDDRALRLVEALPDRLESLDLGYTGLNNRVLQALLARISALPHIQWCSLLGQTLSTEILSSLPNWPLVIVNQ